MKTNKKKKRKKKTKSHSFLIVCDLEGSAYLDILISKEDNRAYIILEKLDNRSPISTTAPHQEQNSRETG